MMVNNFTDADELMNFAAIWGIQDSPAVRFGLVTEQLHNILHILLLLCASDL